MAGARKFPSDLLLVGILVNFANIFVYVPELKGSILNVALGLPIGFFLPGYALMAAIFPSKNCLNKTERATLSFVLSILLVILIGFGLNYTPWGSRLITILVSLSSFTILMCGTAYFRRSKLPENEAFSVLFKDSFLVLKYEIVKKSKKRSDQILTVILIFFILTSVIALAYIIMIPKEGEHYTEFFILGPKGVADNYPTQYELGESGTVIVGVVNHEYRHENYTMEIRLENHSLPLTVKHNNISLAHNESWEEPVTFTPTFKGENMRLEFLLFKETDKTAPYRDLHLWIGVTKK